MMIFLREELKMGKIIVIDGLDGSGKATQTNMLAEKLINSGFEVRKISFPDYESPASGALRMYLNGDFGKDPDSVNPYAASTFFAADRFASFRTGWKEFYENGGIIICDRYTTSNAVHQCSKLPENEWDGFLEWLFDFEYKLMGIPAPDCVIYLRVDPVLSQKLLAKRYDNDETKKDIHERDVDYLRRSEKSADYCAEKLGWSVVECADGGEMRSIEDISDEVFGIVRERL